MTTAGTAGGAFTGVTGGFAATVLRDDADDFVAILLFCGGVETESCLRKKQDVGKDIGVADATGSQNLEVTLTAACYPF